MEYDSYGIPEEELEDAGIGWQGGFRNLDVRIPCFLGVGCKNEVLVTRGDVMHSWGVPSLGKKVDAVPGRTNSLPVTVFRAGTYFGNCYELCGAGHRRMPVGVVSVDQLDLQIILETYCMSLSGMRGHIFSVLNNCGPWFGKKG